MKLNYEDYTNYEVTINGKRYFTANVVDLGKMKRKETQWDHDITVVFVDTDLMSPSELVGFIYGQFDSEQELVQWIEYILNQKEVIK